MRTLFLFCLALLAAGCMQASTQHRVAGVLPHLGHRNWIAVVDMAYPLQSREGVQTIYVGGDQADVVKEVLAALTKAPHVRPVVYLDAELPKVTEADAPGIEAYRKELQALLQGAAPRSLPHEDIIRKLDEAARTYRVLVLKTAETRPYTSVFLELDCGYWTPEAEKRLREAMKK